MSGKKEVVLESVSVRKKGRKREGRSVAVTAVSRKVSEMSLSIAAVSVRCVICAYVYAGARASAWGGVQNVSWFVSVSGVEWCGRPGRSVNCLENTKAKRKKQVRCTTQWYLSLWNADVS